MEFSIAISLALIVSSASLVALIGRVSVEGDVVQRMLVTVDVPEEKDKEEIESVNEECMMVTTVRGNLEGHTRHEVGKANEARRLQGMTGNPTEREFEGMVRKKLIVNLTAISIVRYFYIFVKKNPTGQNDDFICFFVNVATFVNAVVWQITHQLTNGFNRHTYYICCGALPDPSAKNKMNYSLNLLMVLSPVVFLTVISKIRLYKKKVGSFLVQEPQSNSLPSSVELILKTSIADLVTVGVGLLVVVPSTILILHLVNRICNFSKLVSLL